MPQKRPTKLTPALQRAIANAVASGVSLSCAAELVGVDKTTAKEWLVRGMGEHATRPQTPLYAAFADAITRARAKDEARRVKRIEEAGRGGTVIWRKTVTDATGRTTTEERVAPPEWQADAWHLERSRTQEWGRKDRVDLRMVIQETAQKVAEELGIPVDELLIEAQHRLGQVGYANTA